MIASISNLIKMAGLKEIRAVRSIRHLDTLVGVFDK
jgi:hypothetical protein